MRRTARILQTGLLTLALAALSIPVVVNAIPAFLPPAEAQLANLPALQQPPSALSQVTLAGSLKPDAAKVDAAKLGPLLDSILVSDQGNFTAQVLDAASGAVLFDRKSEAPSIPASNLKLLTAAAVLKNLGADSRLETKVFRGTEPGTIVLRAGGDSLLAAGESVAGAVNGHAGLATLAQRVVAALAGSAGPAPLRVIIDDSIFTGPALNPAWDPGDVAVGEIAPIFPLAVNSARADVKSVAGRPKDSAFASAQAFAAALSQAGLPASVDSVRAAGADLTLNDTTKNVLASVQSATIAEQVGYMLQNSDNFVAEVLARMSAISQQKSGSSDDSIAVTESTVKGLGLATEGLKIFDNCGLAPADRVSAALLGQVMRLMTQGPDANVRRAVDGLPIAGLSGTLENRYGTAATSNAAGLIRAKTGTLNTVMTLTGYVVDLDGRLLIFSLMANDFNAGSAAAQPLLDKAAAVLAGCGCR
ncbi:D-alanyl-D-alanine carboxypeptidase/D-alanyl-D-alanine endopeptidase [Renibacterium salmoninarum]|nr:D-alanyl-D-alanine carboxypeptidase/D-alanyl-D-alanine-endopeptidase [Renibacterium salmoninarum]